MDVDVRTLSSIRPLAGAYAFEFPTVAALYAGDPREPGAWTAAIRRAQQHPRQRQELAATLVAQLERRGAPSEARAAAASFDSESTVAVVTGQQAGAFGGPLYTILKAITAIQLARRVSAEHSVRVVPVFWVEAEDHDWAEVRSATVLDPELQPQAVTLAAPPGAGEAPVGALSLGDEVTGTLDDLKGRLAQTDFTGWIDALVRAAYAPGVGVGTAFARLLDALLGVHGLVVFESNDAAFKPLVADLFARELQFPGRTAALASGAGEEMRRIGHEPQVQPQPGAVALFRTTGKRVAIRQEAGQFVAGEERFAASDLVADAVDHPGRFSPNVLLRPVVQDAIFPTICYVAGPSELAYLGQLRGVYEHFGVPMPLVSQRGTATLIDSAALRFLGRHELTIEDLSARDDSTLNRLLQLQLPPSVDQALASAEGEIPLLMQRVIDVIPAVDPTLAGAAKTTLGKMDHDLKTLRGKVIQAAKKKDDTLRRQYTRARAQIYPGGEPQERAIGVVFFLNRYGPALIERLLQDMPVDMGYHRVLAI